MTGMGEPSGQVQSEKRDFTIDCKVSKGYKYKT
jgi:hypothetical protein